MTKPNTRSRHAAATDRPRLYLIRHCRTRWNDQRRVQGSRDIPLSTQGLAQARAIAPTLAGLGIDRIISSPLARAVQTADIYAQHLGVPLETDARLREIDHGAWEGERRDQMSLGLAVAWAAWHRDPIHQPIPDGTETMQEAQGRIVEAVRDALVRYPDATILMVTHMHIRATLLCELNGLGLTHFGGQTSRETGPLPATREQLARLLAPSAP